MEKFRESISQISRKYNLSCSEEEITACTRLISALILTEKELMDELRAHGVEVDSTIETEYILLLYSILRKYTKCSVDLEALCTVILIGTYSKYFSDVNEVLAHYTKRKEELESLENEHGGSVGAVVYALVNVGEKFFDESTVLSAIEVQAKCLDQYLLDEMLNYGVKGWIEKAPENASVDATENEEVKQMGENASVVSDIPHMDDCEPQSKIKRKRTPLEVFHASAQMCVVRNQLEERIKKVSAALQGCYDEYAEYESVYDIYRTPSGAIAKPIIVAWFVAIVISSLIVSDGLIVLATLVAIAAFAIMRALDNQNAKGYAESASAGVREKRIEQENHRKEWEKEKRECTELYDTVTENLREMVPSGGVPEMYWPHAMEIWGFVEQKSADSLKEAINQYKEMERWIKLGKELSGLQERIRTLYGRVENLERENQEMANEINRLAYNDGLRQMGDWFDMKIPPYLYR